MKVLFTGKGGAGSWKIRGEQLAEAMGAKAIPNASDAEIRAADVVVIVKKPGKSDYSRAKLVVWDIVDTWPQPEANNWPIGKAIEYLKGRVRYDAVVYATEQMAYDLGFNCPSLVLPHHYRPGIKINPIRGHVAKVAYEGDERFLQEWKPLLERGCSRRGWEFVVNPASLSDVDCVVALRAGRFGGTLPRRWKSNVKLANAQGSGTPIIANRECGYQETSNESVLWCDSPEELEFCLSRLDDYLLRCEIHERLRAEAFSLEVAAKVYKSWLSSLNF